MSQNFNKAETEKIAYMRREAMGRRMADLGPESFLESLAKIRQLLDTNGDVREMAAHFRQPGVRRSAIPNPIEIASDMFHGYMEDQGAWNGILDRMNPQQKQGEPK